MYYSMKNSVLSTALLTYLVLSYVPLPSLSQSSFPSHFSTRCWTHSSILPNHLISLLHLWLSRSWSCTMPIHWIPFLKRALSTYALYFLASQSQSLFLVTMSNLPCVAFSNSELPPVVHVVQTFWKFSSGSSTATSTLRAHDYAGPTTSYNLGPLILSLSLARSCLFLLLLRTTRN